MDTKKIFLDTNIVLDIIESTRKKHKQALELGKYLLLNDYKILISEDMLTTIFYISKSKQETLIFLKEVVFVDWDVSVFGNDVMKNAIELSLEKNLDLEDVLQCLCAKENGCEAIITHDKKFYDCGLSLFTIEEFLKEKNVQK